MRLEFYLQVLVGASQFRDLDLGSFQLFGIHSDLLLQSFTLKPQELRKVSKERGRKEGRQEKEREEERQKDGKEKENIGSLL